MHLRTILIMVFCSCFWSANAFSEAWELKAGLGPVFGTTFSSSLKNGLGGQAYLEVGITESLSMVAGAGYIIHFIGSGTGYSFTNLGLGVLYKIDVLVVVPFISAKIGWLDQAFDRRGSNSGLAASVAIGFDYLWTKYLTIGFAAEYHGLLTDLGAFPGYAAFMGRIGLRLPK
jgi:hypothetical protein